MNTSVKLTGMDQVLRNIAKLPNELQKSAEKAVLRDGAKPVLKAAKGRAAASKDTGLLSKSLGISVRKKKDGGFSSRVGPRSGFSTVVKGKKKNPVKYAHLVEYGTSHSAAKPFIRPAIDSAQGEVVEAMATGLEKHLTKVCRKLKGGSK